MQLPTLAAGPRSTSALTALHKLDKGVEITYTRRGLEREYSGTLELVLEDAIVIKVRDQYTVIVRIDAIDTIQLRG